MMKKIKLGIIGCGNMGTKHAGYVLSGQCPEIEVVAIADTNPERILWLKDNLEGDITYFDDGIKMLDSGLIDSCIVCVPHYDHPYFAMECMKRGIHVMVEKPAGVHTKQVKEMNAFAKMYPDVVFGLMFNQRCMDVYRKVHEIVHSGKYGEIRRVNWLVTDWYRPQCYYDSGDWRATWSGEGGGVLLNQCPHQLDLWQWICGMPNKIYTKMHFGKWHDIEVEDDVTTYAEYPNGATGVFITSTGDAHGTNRLEIQMDSAKLVSDGQSIQLTEYEMTEQEFSKINKEVFATVKAETIEVDTTRDNPLGIGHVGVLNYFAAAILHGTELIARGEEGINGLTISNAMHLSAFLGKEIELPFDDELFYNELMKRVKTSRRKEGVKAVFADTEGSFAGNR